MVGAVRSAKLTLAGGLLLAAGCGPGGLGLSVDLRTDLVAGVEVGSATTELFLGDSSTPTRTVPRALSASADYTRGARVADFAGLPSGEYTIKVTLYDPAAISVVNRTVHVSLHADFATTVVIARDCRGVRCPTAADPTATTCSGGVCVNPSCTGSPTSTCASECAVDADCHAAVSCAVGRCASGACLFAPLAGACGASMYCDPELGCRGSPVDAGLVDAGTDGGTLPIDLGAPDLGPAPGGLWRLAPGAGSWTELDRGDGSSFAPTSPVRDAFSLDHCDRAYAITDTTEHVLQLSTHAWIASGPRSALFPELGMRAVSSVFSTPPTDGTCNAGGAGQTVIFLVGTDALLYQWSRTSPSDPGTFAYQRTASMPWAGDTAAPDPNLVVADWLALDNGPGWVTGTPYDLCPTSPSMPTPGTPYGPYSAFITSDAQVYVQDDGYCLGAFIRHVPVTSFAPFTLAGAPTFADLGAVFHADGALWVLRE